MKKSLFFIKGILWPILYAFAQSPPQSIMPLAVGDYVPDIIFKNVTNYKSSTARLSDFKGKLILLDFWSSWCGSCLSLFPHLDSLQREFKDELQIILVNTKSRISNDDETKITKILDRVRGRTGSELNIPVVYDCEKLDEYFPCTIIPHEVWIDKNGKVAGITDAADVNADNIQALINGRKVKLKLKKDLSDFDPAKPLFINGNGGDGSEILWRSLVSSAIDGVSSATGIRQSADKVTGFYSINQSLLSLTKTAYNKEIPYENNRVFVSDKAKFDKVYCYELILYDTTVEAMFGYLKDDLKRFFNISVKKEKRNMRCLVLKAAFPPKNTAADKLPDLDIEEATLRKYIHNYPPSFVANLLNDYSTIPIMDETNFSKNISIDLPFSLTDIAGLQAAFKKIGIELKEEDRELEVILITDN